MTDSLGDRMWQWIKDKVVFGYAILLEAGRRYGEYRVSRMSAAVTYRAIFALAPLVLIATWVFGLIVGTDAAQDRIYETIEDFAGMELADAVQQLAESAADGAATTAVVGFLLLFWTASSLFLELQNDLNDIFDVPSEARSGVLAYVLRRGLGFLWTLGIGLLLIGVWALNLVWGLFEGLFSGRGLGFLHDVIQTLAPLVSLTIMPVLFALLIQSLSRVRVQKRALYLGSIFTTIVFLLSAYAVNLYFQWDSETSASRVAGAFFVFLLAAYILSSVLLYGAMVTRTYEHHLQTGEFRPVGPPEPQAVVGQPPPALPVATVLGFLGGLLVAWRRRR